MTRLTSLLYWTVVDDKPWSVRQVVNLPRQQGGSYLGRGNELFYYVLADPTASSERRPLSRGTHRVTVKATLAGTDLTVATTEQTFVLDCGDETLGASDAGASMPETDAGAGRATGASDAGARERAQAGAASGARDGGDEKRGDVDEDDEGASPAAHSNEARKASVGDRGCAVGRVGGVARAWPALGLLLAFTLWLRKRGNPSSGD